MAGRKENLKSLFTNTRSRVIILFTLVILVVAVVVGFAKFYKSSGTSGLSSAVPFSPGIQSIPGALNPTIQYVKLQQAQNVTQARKALNTGSSAIPTIVQSQKLGEGVYSVGAQGGTGGLGFSALSRDDETGLQRSGWIQQLQNNTCSKSTIDDVVNQGAQLSDLKSACTCIQLKDSGYPIAQLESVCSCKELKAAGFSARQLKDSGFSAARLRTCGFNACELRNAGFTAQEMKDGGYSDDELKGAGFTDADIARAGGLPDGISAATVRNAGCDATQLAKLRASGVTASAIRRINGCSIDQLKAAGFTATELKNAGFTAADLKKAGFSAAQLKQAGFTARDLMNAGFTPMEVKAAGYSSADVTAAENELPPGISPDDIKDSGCDVDALRRERIAGVSAKLIKQYAGCGAQALKAAGFTDDDLTNAGFTPQQMAVGASSDSVIRAAGCDPAKLNVLLNQGVSANKIHQMNGCNVTQLKAAGFGAKSLSDAGFSPQDLAAAGFTPDQISQGMAQSDEGIKAAGCDPVKLRALMASGVSAKRIHDLNACRADQLRAAGFDAKSLVDAGFSSQDLAEAGFTPEQIRAAAGQIEAVVPELAAAIKAAACDPVKLHALLNSGASAKEIHDSNGCSASQLKAAGFNAKSLVDAGFTPQQLLAAGFTPQQISAAGSGPASLIAEGRKAGCSVATLTADRSAGMSASTIRQTLGCDAAALKAAGYTASELKAAGFTAAELKSAGFSANDLKAAGFSAKELHAAGFTAQNLKDAGFTPSQLKDAGFSAADLKAAGFTANQLKAAGYTAQDLKDAGFSASDLKSAGFNAEDLKKAGFGAAELHSAGYTANDLKDAGFSGSEIKNAGYNKAELVDAGVDTSEVAGLSPFGTQLPTPSTMPGVPGYQAGGQAAAEANNARQLQQVLQRQNAQLADQKFQQKIQQRTSEMLSGANQSLQVWKNVSAQTYVAGSADDGKEGAVASVAGNANNNAQFANQNTNAASGVPEQKAIIKTGDILFAVIDTSVNSDEPGPILATIVSGRLKGSKLIGSFNLPANANKMIISFNTLSVPGAKSTVSVSAYAIDANTARTALSSNTNHHYMLRYGSLFASSFIEGFGNAFQSANTTITIGGSGSGNNTTTIQGGGAGQSALENAVIGLATVGKAWGQVAQQQFNTPTTVEVYSGTGIGVLFTADLTSL